MKKAQSGFTLLELMLVVTIAGLLLAFGVPAMGNFFRNARITGAANDVMGALHFTRSEAIKRRVPVTLCTSTSAPRTDVYLRGLAPADRLDRLRGDTNQSGQRDAGEVVCCSTRR
jgi:prepilin-type N-terminal cleavage/methylation domain-containing protein